jgi:transcriptional regulator with XRE-family HTH domain
MNFNQRFIDLLSNSSVRDYDLVDILGVSPETVRRWMAGTLLPGRGKLNILLDHIQPPDEIRKQLINLHLSETKKAPKWEKKGFAQKFSEVCDFYTVSKISNPTGISHQNISNWKAGKSLPSVDSLKKIAESLLLDDKTSAKLIRLRDEQKVRKPLGRKRKNLTEEQNVIEKIMSELPKEIIIKSTIPFVRFFYKSTPVLINFKITSFETLFTRCCLAMMRTNSDLLYLLVDQPLSDSFAELYQNYRIMVFTPEEFLGQQNKL